MGQSGIVSVDSIINGPLLTQGMQFAANGYTLVNNTALDALTLVGVPVSGGPNEAVIRVGDGTAGGASYTATIAATPAGAARLVKTDLGTLVLSGVNTYTGGTAVNGGTLQVSQDSNMGALAGGLSLMAARWPRPRHSTRRAPPRWRGRRQHQCRGGHQLRHHQRRRRQRRAEQAGQRHADPAPTPAMPAARRFPPGRCSWVPGGARPRAASWATWPTTARWPSTAATATPLAGSSAARAASRSWAAQHDHPDRRQHLHGRHHDFGGHAATGRGRRHGRHRRQCREQRRPGLQSRQRLRLWRRHQRTARSRSRARAPRCSAATTATRARPP